MTATESSSPPAPSKRSPAVVAAIVVVVVIVLAGGAYVVYKLTDTKEVGEPAYKVSKRVLVAAQQGDTAVIAKYTTAAGAREVGVLKGNALDGMKVSNCSPGPVATKTKICVYTRPGGQLTLALTRSGSAWKVSSANLGPAALPPTSATTPST